jgi:mannosyl-3-phosphoglycerate phosphatase family protein
MSIAMIFTDLDGTLMDHHTYSFAAALSTVSALRDRGIPVIPCTSKTRAETAKIMASLGVAGPMIVENGAAIWVPADTGLVRPDDAEVVDEGWCRQFSPTRGMIRRQLAILNVEWGNRYQSLCDLSDRQVAAVTGLDLEAAVDAKDRHYSETLVWLGTPSDKAAFAEQVEALDLRCTQGARFVHVLGSGGKAEAVSWLQRKIRAELPGFEHAVSVSAGDAQNDVEMLEVTDLALLVRSPVHEPPKPKRRGGMVISDAVGPEGWVEGIDALISRIEEEEDRGRLLSKRHDHNAA